jgi:O-6-methylguanine DNA methyltransferase
MKTLSITPALTPHSVLYLLQKISGAYALSVYQRFPRPRFQSLLRKRFRKDAIRDDRKLKNALRELSITLMDIEVNFESILDLSIGTGFQRKVWKKVSEIPYGELRSYKWIANEIGNLHAVRAVGNAVGKNPVPPIIPCHRVIRSDGKLGGFSSGIALKKCLLKLEK